MGIYDYAARRGLRVLQYDYSLSWAANGDILCLQRVYVAEDSHSPGERVDDTSAFAMAPFLCNSDIPHRGSFDSELLEQTKEVTGAADILFSTQEAISVSVALPELDYFRSLAAEIVL